MIRISIEQAKINSTFDISKNSLQSFKMCYNWCLYKNLFKSLTPKKISR